MFKKKGNSELSVEQLAEINRCATCSKLFVGDKELCPCLQEKTEKLAEKIKNNPNGFSPRMVAELLSVTDGCDEYQAEKSLTFDSLRQRTDELFTCLRLAISGVFHKDDDKAATDKPDSVPSGDAEPEKDCAYHIDNISVEINVNINVSKAK